MWTKCYVWTSDPNLNKPTIKNFWDNWGNLNVDYILGGILKLSVLIGIIKVRVLFLRKSSYLLVVYISEILFKILLKKKQRKVEVTDKIRMA